MFVDPNSARNSTQLEDPEPQIYPTVESDSQVESSHDIGNTRVGHQIAPVAPMVHNQVPVAIQDEDQTSLFIPETFPQKMHHPSQHESLLSMSSPLLEQNLHHQVASEVPRLSSPNNPDTGATPAPKTPSHAPPKELSKLEKIRMLNKRIQQAKGTNRSANKSLLRATNSGDRATSNLGRTFSSTQKTIDDGEKLDREARMEFERKEKYFSEIRRKRGGTLGFVEEVEWSRIECAERARIIKRKRDLLIQQQETGVTMDRTLPGSNPAHIDDSDSAIEIESDDSRKRRRTEMPLKEPPRLSNQDAEIRSMRVAIDAANDRPKKKPKKGQTDPNSSGTNEKGKSSKASKSAKGNTGSKSNKASRRSAKSKKAADQALRQVASLFNADVFEQQADQDARELPKATSRRKQDALKEMIASVPVGDKKEARSDMAILLSASKDYNGHGAVQADGRGMWLVKGMSTSLKPYQLTGGAFLRRRENAAEEPRGGLMADQMGLGKTLMMLSNIINGRPPQECDGPRTTLIVASPALLTQWSEEIHQHTDPRLKPRLKVLRYGHGNRVCSTEAPDILASHDIILTTYTEIMKSCPKNEPPVECQTAAEKAAWWEGVWSKERGILHRMEFLRVVLDEAQAIKNATSRTSIACRSLWAQHKWCLSGTPIMNSLVELYPYFKFIEVPHTGNLKVFKNNYCQAGNPENTERLLVRLSQFMLRRTHADHFLGAPILKLPKATQAVYWCEFNPVERSIYNIVRERFANRLNVLARADDIDKSYSNALVMLLRLRQLTSSILMLQFVMRDLLEREDIEQISQVLRDAETNLNSGSGRTILAVRKQLDALETEDAISGKAKNRSEGTQPVGTEREGHSTEAPSNHVRKAADPGSSGKAFGKEFNFQPYLKSLATGDSWEKAKERATCGYCHRTPKNPWMTSCGHFVCEDPCLERMNIEAAEIDTENSPCKTCGQRYTYCRPCEVRGEDFQNYSPPSTRAASKKKRDKPDNEDISDEWINLGGDSVLPSAKTIAIKAQILNWISETPDVKVIVYTQFLAMIRILAKVCQEEGWNCEQYHGKLSFTARDKAISAFAHKPEVKILLASLQCGGLGLNLTMASKVILIDPWWNSAVEQQAFCRVFRIGQHEQTSLTKLCVKDTVDERLIEMQERKKEEINEIMEDDGSRVKNMSIRDLMRLFGNLMEDSEGKPYILVDNPDPRGGFRADPDDEGYADEL